MIKTDKAERLARVKLTDDERKAVCDELNRFISSADAFPTDGELYNASMPSFVREDIPSNDNINESGSIYSSQRCMPTSEK